MKSLKFFTMSLGIIASLSVCKATASEKKSSKTEKPKPVFCSRCKAEIKKETDKAVAAKRGAEFMAKMEKVKKRDPKRYATEMVNYKKYKALQELRKKDPKAYRAKMKELREKQISKSQAAFKARMEKLERGPTT